MARATLSCPLQARQLSGAASSSSNSMLGDTSIMRQSMAPVGRVYSRRNVTAQAPQQHQSTLVGSKTETPRWMPNAFLDTPAPAWIQTSEPPPQFARCSWPKEQPAPVMFAEEEEGFSGQQLHEEFAAVLRRSKSRELLVQTEERQPGPRSAWPRSAVPSQSGEAVLGPRCAWPRAVSAEVLGPRCEYLRQSVLVTPTPVSGAACAWPQEKRLSATAVEAEPMHPGCDWPRKEAMHPRCEWPRKELEEVKPVAVMGASRSATGTKSKRASRGWPWGVVAVGLEPIFDQDVAEGPRCAWPRMLPQLVVEEPLRQDSAPLPAPRCEWPGKQSAFSVSQPSPSSPAHGPACSWPRKVSVEAVSAQEEPVLGPRCALKVPEQVLGPRCALKLPQEAVLGPRCALKLPVEEVRVEGPRCVWPKPGSEVEEQLKAQGPRCAWPKPGVELAVPQPAEEKENVAPVKKRRVGLFPRRGLFTSIPVRVKGPVLARVGKVKVAVPQLEAGKEAAKPAEKVAATWQRRALATSLGLGVINQALLNSQAQAAGLEVPAVTCRKLQGYKSLNSENRSS